MTTPLTVRRLLPAARASLSVLVLAAAAAACSRSTAYAQEAAAPSPCTAVTTATAVPPPLKPTTITAIEQAYNCIFAHYYAGPALDDRVLLVGAFAGFTNELEHLGLDQADATLPALTGNRASDLAAFAAVYQQVTGQMHVSATVRQDLAAATMNAMVASLNDNHALWAHPVLMPGLRPGEAYGLGTVTSPANGLALAAPQEAQPPLYITRVQGGPVARAGLRPGDVIESVNGASPFTDGVLATGVMDLLNQMYPQDQPVRLVLWRPAIGRTWTVTIRPAAYAPGRGTREVREGTRAGTREAAVRSAGHERAACSLPCC